ncbi:MAG: hypothetical protein LBK97_05905 [Prevotellaceae bacterium]|nr:hypothetical protein [Prevotellaceae bacterium]
MNTEKKILYIDMDNVLVDFQSGIDRLSDEMKKEYERRLDEVPGIFSLMEPVPGAVAAVNLLSQYFDAYILSTAPWKNISAWSDKATWVQKYFGDNKDSVFYKRLIISHHKNLNKGDYLIDDRPKNGASEFEGEWLQLGSERFPKWSGVVRYLMSGICECFSNTFMRGKASWSKACDDLGVIHDLRTIVPDVYINTCKHCDRKWISIFDDGPCEDTQQWFRILATNNDLKNISPQTVIKYFLSKDWSIYGGPYYMQGGERYHLGHEKESALWQKILKFKEEH